MGRYPTGNSDQRRRFPEIPAIKQGLHQHRRPVRLMLKLLMATLPYGRKSATFVIAGSLTRTCLANLHLLTQTRLAVSRKNRSNTWSTRMVYL